MAKTNEKSTIQEVKLSTGSSFGVSVCAFLSVLSLCLNGYTLYLISSLLTKIEPILTLIAG